MAPAILRSVGRRWQRRGADERGTTLVELLVTMAIFTVVIVLTLNQLTQAIQRTTALDRASVAAGDARRAFDSLSADLRQASTFTPTLTAVSAITPTAMTFYSPNRSTPMRLRRISYRLTGTTLERSEVISDNAGTAPWTFSATPVWLAVINDVRNTNLFAAYDLNGNATATLNAVRSIKATVLAGSNLSGAAQIKHEIRVSLRVTA